MRLGADVTIEGAVQGALKRMIVSPYWKEESDVLWIRADMQELDRQLYFDTLRREQLTQQFVVECQYRGGGKLLYWYGQTPSGFSSRELRAKHREHPLLRIQPPMAHCPERVPT